MTRIQSTAQGLLVRLGIDRLAEILVRLDVVVHTERREAKQRARERNLEVEQLEAIRDEIVLLGEMSETLGQLALVGLYSLVEHRMKALMAPYAASKAELDSFYRIDALKGVSQARFQINLERDVKNFSAVDEIRLINNAVKHSGGMVSPKLALAFPRWKQGRPLGDLKKAFNRLAPKVPPFFKDLALRLPNPPRTPPSVRRLP